MMCKMNENAYNRLHFVKMRVTIQLQFAIFGDLKPIQQFHKNGGINHEVYQFSADDPDAQTGGDHRHLKYR